MNSAISGILLVFFVASAALTASAIRGARLPAYNPLPPRELQHAEVWTVGELTKIEETGRSGSIKMRDGRAFVQRVRSEYTPVAAADLMMR